MNLKKQSGQGLIEYLLIVALLGVAGIGVLKLLQNTINVQFSNTIQALQGKRANKIQSENVETRHYKKKDLRNFMKGAVNSKSQKE